MQKKNNDTKYALSSNMIKTSKGGIKVKFTGKKNSPGSNNLIVVSKRIFFFGFRETVWKKSN